MSFDALRWAISAPIPKPLPKLVLILLADCLNGESGHCHPSLDYLATKAGAHRTTVLRAVQWLEQKEWVLVAHRHRSANSYDLNFAKWRVAESDYSGSGERPLKNPLVAESDPASSGERLRLVAESDSNQEENQEENLNMSEVEPFPTTSGPWTPSPDMVSRWEETFGVDFLAEQLAMARLWLLENPHRQKTPRGMSRFVGHWLRNSKTAWKESGGTSRGKPYTLDDAVRDANWT